MNISIEQMEALIQLGVAVDGSNGGLLIGPGHDEGGINVFWLTDTGYVHSAEFEGWEYLLNAGATLYYQDTCNELNNHSEDIKKGFQEYKLLNTHVIIDCRMPAQYQTMFNSKSKMLVLKGPKHFIFNRYSTKLHLETLNNMNRGRTFRYNNQDILKATSISVIDVITGAPIETFDLVRQS